MYRGQWITRYNITSAQRKFRVQKIFTHFLINKRHHDVNKNGVEVLGKLMVETKIKGLRKEFKYSFVIKRKTKPLLRVDWLQEFNRAIQNIDHAKNGTNQSQHSKLESIDESL